MNKQIVVITRTGEYFYGTPYAIDIDSPKMFDFENSPTVKDFFELYVLIAVHNLRWVDVKRWYMREVELCRK